MARGSTTSAGELTVIRRTLALLLLVSLAAEADPATPGPVAGHQPGEEAAVLAVVDRYLAAISAQDHAAMAALQMPDGMTYRARPAEGGGIEVVGRPNAYWVDPARRDARVLREQYWSPTVLIRGSIALVWAPYEFRVDNKTTHCGVDTFDFVQVEGQWRVANMMWTVEPDACAELRPAGAVLKRAAHAR
jgi:hypothetical protein